MNTTATRRQFLKTTSTATLGSLSMSALLKAQSAPAIVSGSNLNSRIGIGFIGCGNRASRSHMTMLENLKNEAKLPIDFVAVCDAYRPRLDKAKARLNAARACMDYRELLADKGVDMVCIATPDHQHGYQAIDAVQAGKHVYCEKPITHWRQFELTKKLAEVVAKSDRAFVCGAQAMSDGAWGQMKKLVEDGLIGKPVYGETGFFICGDGGDRGMPVDDPNALPGADLDWEAFLGDAPKRDFTVDRFFRWRLFEDYAGGPGTDLLPHCLTPLVDILGVGFPETVVAVGGIDRWEYELREVPDSFSLLAHYPEKVTVAVLGTEANDMETATHRGAGQSAPVIRGWDGSLTIDPNNKEIVFTSIRKPNAKHDQRFPIERGENNAELWRNLIECAQNGTKDTWSPMDLAFRVQTVLQMAMMGFREGKVMRFDATEKKILG
jgi:predicted dehydrogenase